MNEPIHVATASDLTDRLRLALSGPDVSAGMRLVPEHLLANAIGVRLRVIRRAMNALVEEGVLVRRQGSGTYVRKPPTQTGVTEDGLTALDVPGGLFAKTSAPSRQALRRPWPQTFQLGVCTDFPIKHSAAGMSVLAGIVHRANEGGHGVTMLGQYPVLTDPSPAAREALRRQFEEKPVDGLIFTAGGSHALAELLNAHDKPMLDVALGNAPVTHHTQFCQDASEAAQRAVFLLADQGYRRIGLVCSDERLLPHALVREAYRFALRFRELSYNRIIRTEVDYSAAQAAMDAAFHKAPPPDALYVSDDNLLGGVAAAVASRRRKPGRNMGIITLSNRGVALPNGAEWSCLEFDPEGLGRRLVDELLRMIQTRDRVESCAIRAVWRPGKTHLRGKKQ